MRYELSEIRAAALLPGEDDLLSEEIKLMQNSEKIFEVLSSSYDSMYSQEYSASDILGKASRALETVSVFSREISEIAQAVSEAYYRLEDISHVLRRCTDSTNFSPEELDEKITRLEAINSLKRKYGGSIESIFAYEKKAESMLHSIENADEEIAGLENRKNLLKEQYSTACQRLSALRKRAAEKLSGEITRELQDLHFRDGIFIVRREDGPPSEKGSDAVEFLISANKGESPKPLAKIASGGELSRIMLAMKKIIGDLDRIPTMIFDEIDSGISGSTAGIVGKKLDAISKTHQVLCITHLPQIAAFGVHHYCIEKTSDEISTHTTVTPLDPDQRVEELARLLSGTVITDLSRENARELLRLSRA
jgi:DNA repair protein RecN (Recombination protein N)